MWFERQYDNVLECKRGATTQGKEVHKDKKGVWGREMYTEGDGDAQEGIEEHQLQKWNTKTGVYRPRNEIQE